MLQDKEYREKERKRDQERSNEVHYGVDWDIFDATGEWDKEDTPLTKEEEKRIKKREEDEADRQKLMIIHALSVGSTRKDFWYGTTQHDYPFLLDTQFKKDPDLAVWMDQRRVGQTWVCHECGITFDAKRCGKCPMGVYCMEKGCKIECGGCTANQEHYLGDYQKWLKSRYKESDKSWIDWAEASLASLSLDDDDGLPKRQEQRESNDTQDNETVRLQNTGYRGANLEGKVFNFFHKNPLN